MSPLWTPKKSSFTTCDSDIKGSSHSTKNLVIISISKYIIF